MKDDFAMNAPRYQGSIIGEYENSAIGENGFTAILRAEGSEPTTVLGKPNVDPTRSGLSIETSWPAAIDSIVINILEDFLTREACASVLRRADQTEAPPAGGSAGMLML